MRIWTAQLRKGLIELAVLAALCEGEAYGYQILQRLGRVDGLAITESTVYPLLARLARDGMVKSAPPLRPTAHRDATTA
jgi:PadR family transcriptional regulator PadR